MFKKSATFLMSSFAVMAIFSLCSTQANAKGITINDSSSHSISATTEMPFNDSSSLSISTTAEIPINDSSSLSTAYAENITVSDSSSLSTAYAEKITVSDSSSLPNANAKKITVNDAASLSSALLEAKSEATDEEPYIITLTTSVDLTSALAIYSNTTLILNDGVTIKQTKSTSNILRVGSSQDEAMGYYYRNISIEGGTWDGNKGTATGLKIAHAQNVSLKNMNIKNVKNAHLMEVAGVDGLTVDNCNFSTQTVSVKANKLTYEAIQLDVLVKGHFTGYKYFEDLPNKNISITNCSFKNVPRGVGSHTGILNNPISNISITNCKFEKTKSCAIQLFNVENVTISGNTISGSPRGITILSSVYPNQDTYLASDIAKSSGIKTDTPSTYVVPKENQCIIIDNNTISTSGTDPYAYYGEGAIWINGKKASSKADFGSGEKDNIPHGDYYISGVTISNNVIKTHGFGVKLCDTRNTQIFGNNLSFSAKKYTDGDYGFSIRENTQSTDIYSNQVTGFIYGAYVIESSINSIKDTVFTSQKSHGIYLERNGCISNISGNTIANAGVNGVYFFNYSSAGIVASNIITSPGRHAIVTESYCGIDYIQNNNISLTGCNGIYLYNNSKAQNISNNTIDSPTLYCISVERNSLVTFISENTLSKAGVNGIYIIDQSGVENVNKNKITSPGFSGIIAEKNATVTSVTENNVSKAGVNGIYVLDGSKVTDLKSNKISSPKNFGISVDETGYVKSISSNTISKSAGHGITVRNSTVDSITKNKVSGAKQNGIYLESSTAKNINSNTIKTSSINGIHINVKSKVSNIKKNTISKCNGFGICATDKSKVTKCSGNVFTNCTAQTSGIK